MPYPPDKVIQPLNNWGLMYTAVRSPLNRIIHSKTDPYGGKKDENKELGYIDGKYRNRGPCPLHLATDVPITPKVVLDSRVIYWLACWDYFFLAMVKWFKVTVK